MRRFLLIAVVWLLAVLVLAGGLALALWFTGGRAVSPGRLLAANHGGVPLGDVMSHAEVNDA